MSASPFLQILSPSARNNPYPLYRRILDEYPVSEGPGGMLVLARHVDCAPLVRDLRLSNDYVNSARHRQQLAADELTPADLAWVEQRSFLFRDPPDHTRLRRLVSRAFTARVVAGLRARIQTLVDELLDQAATRGNLELVGDLAFPLPVTVICELLGVPLDHHDQFKQWSRAIVRVFDPAGTVSPDEQRSIGAAMRELTDYFAALIAQRRSSPRDDLLSRLIAAEEQGEQLTADEINSICRLLLVAGHETTVNLIANGMLTLLRHPDQLDLLRGDASLAPCAVEEILRFDPPVHFLQRTAKEDVEICGRRVRAGNPVVLLIAAANRDPERFPDPDRFDITRSDNPHLTFGAGVHFCIGAPLARLEGQVALASLAQRLVDPELTNDPLVYKEHVILRGLETLPIRVRDVKPA